MGSRLQIRVLGELSVQRDGQAVALPASRKTRALLAYLAVANRPQRREHLCRLFWEVPDDPRAALRWSLTKLRHALHGPGEQPCLRTDGGTVFIDPEAADIDWPKVMKIPAGDVGSRSTADLEALAALFRGRFLEDLEIGRCPAYEGWRVLQADAADRIRSLILRALVERLRRAPERALPYAQALFSLQAPGSSESSGSPAAAAAAPAIRHSQEIRYCRGVDGVRIAYAVCGRGPPLLRAAHWMSHLQFEWESPVWRHWIDALSDGSTLIRYDERGNGLSDWDVADLSFAAMVSDLESVADANRLERFPLLGVSQSCAVSVAYAVRHPERVSRLVLYGGYAQGWRKRGDRHQVSTHEAMTTLIREGWGQDNPAFRQMFTETFIPGASREQMAWFNDLQKRTAPPGNASRLHDAFGDMDVSAILQRVTVPTLVLHARHDAAVPFEQGRALAAGIPGARFVDLDSANHILLAEEPAFAEFLRELRSFVGVEAPPWS